MRCSEVTFLLQAWQDGDATARDRLLPIVYAELHSLARARFGGEAAGHTLQATALVHELYLKLVGQERARWHNRIHFLSVASQMMRRILIDHARIREARKRGSGRERVPLDDTRVELAAALGGDHVEVLALEAALEELEALDPRLARIVELRFFGGLTVSEAAQALGVSTPTVKRDWATARAWLWDRLRGG